jgi:hypothetical protein
MYRTKTQIFDQRNGIGRLRLDAGRLSGSGAAGKPAAVIVDDQEVVGERSLPGQRAVLVSEQAAVQQEHGHPGSEDLVFEVHPIDLCYLHDNSLREVVVLMTRGDGR